MVSRLSCSWRRVYLANPTIDTCSLKTSLFKWTPNHDGAAQAFSRAGQWLSIA